MNIIDLTHEMEQGMPCFHADWHTAFSSETLGTIESVGRNTKKTDARQPHRDPHGCAETFHS